MEIREVKWNQVADGEDDMTEEVSQEDPKVLHRFRDRLMSCRRCSCHGKLLLLTQAKTCICAIYRCQRCRRKVDYLCNRATMLTLSDRQDDVKFGMQMHKDHLEFF